MNKLSLTIATILSLSGAAAHACDCNKAADRAKYPAQCGITTIPGQAQTGTNTQGQGQSVGNLSTGSSTSAGGSSNQGQGQSVGNLSTGSSTSAGGSSNQGQGQSVGNLSTGSSTSDSSNQGNTFATTDNYQAARIPVASALAGFQQTTAGCRFAEGLGIQLSQAGTSVGFTFKDHDCVRFQLAEFFYSRHQDIAGDRIICAVHEVRAVLGDDCEALVHQIVATVPADAVTHKELATFGRAVRQSEGLNK